MITLISCIWCLYSGEISEEELLELKKKRQVTTRELITIKIQGFSNVFFSLLNLCHDESRDTRGRITS